MGNTLPQAGSGKPCSQAGVSRSKSTFRTGLTQPTPISGPVLLEDPGLTLITYKGLCRTLISNLSF